MKGLAAYSGGHADLRVLLSGQQQAVFLSGADAVAARQGAGVPGWGGFQDGAAGVELCGDRAGEGGVGG